MPGPVGRGRRCERAPLLTSGAHGSGRAAAEDSLAGAPLGRPLPGRRAGGRILPGMRVRDATRADAEAVHALLAGIYREGGYFVNDGPEPLASLAARIEGSPPTRSLFLVAERAEEVVGWLELHRSTAARLEHVAVLTLAVAPQARRQGVGRALMRRSYDWCARVGALKVSLNVRASNVGAIRLYEAEGFEHEGRERNQVRLVGGEGEGFEDNLIMGRWLGRAER